MNRFAKIASEQVSLSPIMVGRTPLDTEDILDVQLTIVGFNFAPKIDENGEYIVNADGEVETYGVVIFKEFPDSYYSAGHILSNVCHAWAAAFESVEEASAALALDGGVKAMFKAGKTKKGRNITTMEILE